MNPPKFMQRPQTQSRSQGFSLLELLISLSVVLVLLSVTSTLIVRAFNTRSRENQRSDALADAQRALNIMTREIANSGFGLTNNGIVAADSGATTIRVQANLNALDGQTTSVLVGDRNEDVKYALYSVGGSSYIVRLDIGTENQTTVLANRIDSLRFRYYGQKINYTMANSDCDISTTSAEVTDPTQAKYIVMSICVDLPQVGRPGSAGYQPTSRVQIVSDVSLRNSDMVNY